MKHEQKNADAAREKLKNEGISFVFCLNCCLQYTFFIIFARCT